MKAIKFDRSNSVLKGDGDRVSDLHVYKNAEGTCISCWELTWKDKLRLLLGRPLWLMVLTFNHPYQPTGLMTYNPFIEEPDDNDGPH